MSLAMSAARARCFPSGWMITWARTIRSGRSYVFVDELDLGALGFGNVEPEATGRPAYHPATLLKAYVYGYLNRGAVEPPPGGRSASSTSSRSGWPAA